MSVSWSQESCQTLSYQDHTLNNSQAEKYEKKKQWNKSSIIIVNFDTPTDGCYSCKHTNIAINKLLQTFTTVNNNNNIYLSKKIATKVPCNT